MTSVSRTTLLVCGLGLLPLSALAADKTAPEPDDCALIENGVARLACYDKIFNANEKQATASESDVKKAKEDAAEAVPVLKQKLPGEDSSGDTAEENNAMQNLLQRYMAAEQAMFSFSGSFVAHRPTYILPITWMKNPNPDASSPTRGPADYDYDLDRKEAKYQISFKIPLLTGWLKDRTTLWFGYTQKSFWQVYNQDDSAPFRETNYEPEIFLRYQTDWAVGPGTLSGVTLGFNHQSNGQSNPRSRSWNRIIGTAAYSYGRWLFMVQPWYRIPEGSDNDNPDIEKYVGYANYHAVYKLDEDRTFSLKLMNNLRSDNNHTSVEFGYSFPMGDTIKGFFQYYNGYGESLIDYNHRIERFGIGIMLNDWL